GLQHESADPTTLGYDMVIDLNADRQAAPVVAELAADQLQTLAAGEAPFLMVVGMFEPHRPFPAHRFPVNPGTPVDMPPYLVDTDQARDDLRGFHSAITYADQATGRILDAIDGHGLDRDTIVIFTTDHGIPFPRAKSTLYDAGIEVAMIVRMPTGTQAPAPASDQLVSLVDVTPTVLDLLDVAPPANLQGVSFAGALRPADTTRPADPSRGQPQPRAEIFAEKNWHGLRQYDPVRCVRTGSHKYIVSFEDRPHVPLPSDIAQSGSAIGVDAERERGRVELYDLTADPHETTNLAGEPSLAEVEADLARRLREWQISTHDPVLEGPVQAARVMGSAGGPRHSRTELIEPVFVQRN
ncbi:MAG: sulfatase-like hydrolase/transferase, partial [Micromonosporaceae bacterium]